MGGMNDLPFDISWNIFSRLHVDSVLECKLVCKPWSDVIKNPSFAQIHLAASKLLLQKLNENYIRDVSTKAVKVKPWFLSWRNVYKNPAYGPIDLAGRKLQKLDKNYIQDVSTNACETVHPGFLLLAKTSDGSHNRQLKYVEYSGDAELKIKTVNIPLITQNFESEAATIGSCNGLICSTVYHHKLNDPIHICNPVTREYVYLPRYTSEQKAYRMLSGFGYCHSTDEYKVIRIYHKGNESWRIQIYILGNESSKWTEEKEIPCSIFRNIGYYPKGVLVNGEIHWLDEASKIVAFNLADEKFRYIASPPLVPGSPYNDRKRLSVLGYCLCLTHQKPDTTDIWLLRKNNDMNLQQDGTCKWNKEFTLQAITKALVPLAFTKEGKVLFWQDHTFVSCYNPKTAVLEKLSKDESAMISHQAAHHINSFVSLKALGIKNCKRRLKYKAQDG